MARLDILIAAEWAACNHQVSGPGLARAMRRAHDLGKFEAFEDMRSVPQAAKEAGVSNAYAYKFLAQVEERGVYKPYRSGPTVLVSKKFVELLKPWPKDT